MRNIKKLSTLAFTAAVVASMAFVFMSSGGIKTVLGQGTNKTSMSSMNMTGTAGSNSGNMPGMGGMRRSMGGGGNMPGMGGMSRSMGGGGNMPGMGGMRSSMGGGGNMPGMGGMRQAAWAAVEICQVRSMRCVTQEMICLHITVSHHIML